MPSRFPKRRRRLRPLCQFLLGHGLLLVLCGSLAIAHAQPRPRIGLVLSGGGARGAAHIGVLKVLEELRVPIDCIAGTSMGSIVGGAYASGMTVEQMERAIGAINSAGLFREQPPRAEQLMRRKLDDRENFIGPEFGLTLDGLGLPKGAVSGVALEAVLRNLSSRARGERSFDELPIPYRAVATDIESGKMVVLSRGDLAASMRASMSVPGAIAPAEINGRLLVDGGLVRNLPIDIARDLCADIVIAVNLGTPLLRRGQITSAFSVTAQMLNILTEQNVQSSLASLRPEDILIAPELGDFSAGDFDNLKQTVPIGEKAARRMTERLVALALDPASYAARYEARTGERQRSSTALTEIRFEGLSRVNDRVLADMMNTRVGEPIDQTTLDRDLRLMFGRGDFERVDYRVDDDAGRRTLVIRPVEKEHGPNYARFGLTLSTDLYGDAWFNLSASARKTWINALGGEWRVDAQLGRFSLIATEFNQPLTTAQDFFVSPRVDFDRRIFDVYNGDDRRARFSVKSARAGVDVGSLLGKYGDVRVGVYRGHLEYELDTGPELLVPTRLSFPQGGWRLKARADQLDSLSFPRRGFAGQLEVLGSRTSMAAFDSYTKWDFNWLSAFSLSRHTLSAGLRLAGVLGGSPLPDYDPIIHGGFLQQSGFRYGQLLGDRLNFGRLVYQYQLADAGIFDGAYLGSSFELGKIGNRFVADQPSGWLKSMSLFVAVDSPLGPLYLGIGRSATGQSNAYLLLGRL